MQNIPLHDFSALVQSIYDCAIDPSRWDTTIADIKTAFGSANAIIALVDAKEHRFMLGKFVGLEPDWMVTQAPFIAEQQIYLEQNLARWTSFDEPMALSRFSTEEERNNSPYLQQWAAPRGLGDIMSMMLLHAPDRQARLDMGFPKDMGAITDAQIDLARLIIPHVRRAVMISNVLDVRTIERNRLAETLDALRYAVFIVDANGRILHANTAGEAMSRAGDLITVTGGNLYATRPRAASELEAAVKVAARNEMELGKTGLAVMLTPPEAPPTVAHVLPLARGDYRTQLQPAAVAAIFVGQAADLQASARQIALRFGLTPAERNVFAELLSGRTLAEAANTLGVSVNTTRTHLASIFGKTGVSRQVDLIRLAAQEEKFVG
ncbi:MAG: LuxR C-terminal-related transcriptional regulator [Hyphomicrobiales bacterium]|nr:LuxR C-terminal-related transcriptional regulator [Hyphomicrobiales bacterium]